MKFCFQYRVALTVLSFVLFLSLFVPVLCPPRNEEVACRLTKKLYADINKKIKRHGGIAGVLASVGIGKGRIVRVVGATAAVIGKTHLNAFMGPYKYSLAFLAGGFGGSLATFQNDFNPLVWQRQILIMSESGRPGTLRKNIIDYYADLNPMTIRQQVMDLTRPGGMRQHFNKMQAGLNPANMMSSQMTALGQSTGLPINVAAALPANLNPAQLQKKVVDVKLDKVADTVPKPQGNQPVIRLANGVSNSTVK